MIQTQTVLILGAGASGPYGFPSGYELLIRVLDLGIANQLIRAGFEAGEVKQFQYSLGHSGTLSVDAFLEHRPEFLRIGKFAIALLLIPFEDEARLFTKYSSPGWYDYLFGQLSTDFDSFGANRLSIITFNYD